MLNGFSHRFCIATDIYVHLVQSNEIIQTIALAYDLERRFFRFDHEKMQHRAYLRRRLFLIAANHRDTKNQFQHADHQKIANSFQRVGEFDVPAENF